PAAGRRCRARASARRRRRSARRHRRGWSSLVLLREVGGPGERVLLRGARGREGGIRIVLGAGRAHLLALDHVAQRGVVQVRGVDEGDELRAALRIAHRLGPFVDVGVGVALHGRLELLADAEGVLDDHAPQRVYPAGVLLDPARGALELVRFADVEDEEAIDAPLERLVVEVLDEQLGVGGLGAAVAADVEVPPAVGGDHADVLRLGLGALARAAGDADLDL